MTRWWLIALTAFVAAFAMQPSLAGTEQLGRRADLVIRPDVKPSTAHHHLFDGESAARRDLTTVPMRTAQSSTDHDADRKREKQEANFEGTWEGEYFCKRPNPVGKLKLRIVMEGNRLVGYDSYSRGGSSGTVIYRVEKRGADRFRLVLDRKRSKDFTYSYKLEYVLLADGSLEGRYVGHRNCQTTSLKSTSPRTPPTAAATTTVEAPAKPGATRSKEMQVWLGVWKGEYTCNNGRQKTRLELNIQPSQTDGRIDAVFAFQTYKGPVAEGSLRMSGDFPSSGDLIRLQPKGWIKQPDGYATVGLEARLVENQSLLRGRILVSGCSEFALSRLDNPESAGVRNESVSAAEVERKSVRIGDYDATYQMFAANGCGFPIDITIRSTAEPAFANGHPQALASEIGAYVQSYCASVPAIRVSGFAGQDMVFEGDLSKTDQWRIKSTLTPLDIARNYLQALPIELASLRRVKDYMADEHRLGGPRTPDGQALRQIADTVTLSITEQALTRFRTLLAAVPANVEGLTQIETMTRETLGTVGDAISGFMEQFNAATNTRIAEIRREVVAGLVSELAETPSDWQAAVQQIALAEKRGDELGQRVPEAVAVVREAVVRLTSAIDAGLPTFRENLAAIPVEWSSLERLSDLRSSLTSSLQQAPGLESYISAVDDRRSTVFAALPDKAVEEITSKGNAVSDLEAVLDAGEAWAGKFRSAGRDDIANTLLSAMEKRVDELVRAGFAAFREGVVNTTQTRESLSELREALLEYANLELSVPAFADYRIAIADRVASIEEALCTKARSRSGLSASLASQKLALKDEMTTLGAFVCSVDEAEKSISQFGNGWFSSNVTATYRGSDGQESVLEFGPSPESGDENALIGMAVTTGSERQEITRAEWFELATHIIEPAISGRPDMEGITECDRLAADPDDPKKLTPGVAADKLSQDARALEACIAALEHDPANVRLRYQLGRVLLASGADEEARSFLDRAALGGHAAAYASLGDLLFFDESAEKQALEQYRKALTGGYTAAKDRVDALSASQQIDISKGWPATGTIKLRCYLEVSEVGGSNEILFFDAPEVGITINLESKAASFNHSIVSVSGAPLVNTSQRQDVTILTDVVYINLSKTFGVLDGNKLSINKHDLRTYYKNTSYMMSGYLTIGGSCLQDF